MTAAEHPWFGILVTLAAWVVATRLRKWSGTPLVDPVLVSVIMIIFFLIALEIPYENYNVGGSVISFLLGPAVVALAVPFYRHLARVRQHLFPVVVLTGILGSMAGPQIARVVGIKGDIAQGLAVGTAAHGLGTSRALRENEGCHE
jgi:putative effector of murein hydrolase